MIGWQIDIKKVVGLKRLRVGGFPIGKPMQRKQKQHIQTILLRTSPPYRFIAGWDEQQMQEGYGSGRTVFWAL